MSQEYDNTNRGALFKNDKKSSDNHPDYRGQLDVEGDEFWVSAWIKTSKAGKKFMSLSITPKEQEQQERQPAASRSSGRQRDTQPSDEFDDDIPF